MRKKVKTISVIKLVPNLKIKLLVAKNIKTSNPTYFPNRFVVIRSEEIKGSICQKKIATK